MRVRRTFGKGLWDDRKCEGLDFHPLPSTRTTKANFH